MSALRDGTETTTATRARALAHDFLAMRPPATLAWSWRTAIFLHGAVALGAATGDLALLDAVRAFFANPRHARVAIRRSDAAACALPALTLYEATGCREGLPFVDRALAYLRVAKSSEHGAPFHLGHELWARPLPDSVWADSLMMVGVLLARASAVRADEVLRARALTVTRAFVLHLGDPRAGLFLHADVPRLLVSFPTRGAFWLRGNGWMLAAASEICAALSLTPREREEMARAFLPAADALVSCARTDGSWPNMLHARGIAPRRDGDLAPRALVVADAGAPMESSGTALVAAGLIGLASQGILAPRARYEGAGLAALSAASSCVSRDRRGRMVLRNTKGLTNAGPSFQYALVPEAVNADYGVGALMLGAATATTSAAAGATRGADDRAVTSSAPRSSAA